MTRKQPRHHPPQAAPQHPREGSRIDHASNPQAALAAVSQRVPDLTHFGIGIWDRGPDHHRLTPAEYALKFIGHRQALLCDIRTFQQVCDWLACLGTRARINPRAHSYRLKHIAENELGVYVANGTFIAAAVHRGYRYRLAEGDPNVVFNMDERDIRAARQRGWLRKYGRVAS